MKSYLFIFVFALFSSLNAQEELITQLIYQENSQHPKIKFTYYGNKLIERCFFHYNSRQECDQVIIDNGTSENSSSMEGATGQLVIHFGLENEDDVKMTQIFINLLTGEQTVLKETSIACPHELIEQMGIRDSGFDEEVLENPLNSLKLMTTYLYDEEGKLTSILSRSEETPPVTESYEFQEQSNEYFSDFSQSLQNIFYHQENLAFFENLESSFEELLQFLMGPLLFRISGYHTHPPRIGVHGQGEINDKVRITLINGILNYPLVQTKHLEMFSQMHGGVNIHHVFRPCEGWSIDMLRCAATKLGFISNEAMTLAQKWKELIAEMGGPNGGGLIIHYAHSIGGTETDNAKRLMTPEELRMIRVYTLASPTIIHNEGFQRVMNYVSRRDGVCYLDPIDYVSGLFTEESNIIYLDTFLGTPIVDHLITSDSYRAIIEQLGAEFVETYGVVLKNEANEIFD